MLLTSITLVGCSQVVDVNVSGDGESSGGESITDGGSGSGSGSGSGQTLALADLAGPWAMSLTGVTGCGVTTMYVTFVLNDSGSGAATIQGHTAGCGDATTTGLSFAIDTLNANGNGTGGLSCGSACGWNLIIQVSHDRSIFSVIDVSSANPGNFVQGIAIHQ